MKKKNCFMIVEYVDETTYKVIKILDNEKFEKWANEVSKVSKCMKPRLGVCIDTYRGLGVFPWEDYIEKENK